MREEDFTNPLGTIQQEPKTVFHTFEPQKLPVPVDIPAAMLKKISAADRKIGELSGISGNLSNPHLLIEPYKRKEALLSSQIEGTRTTLEEVFIQEVAPSEEKRDAKEVVNHTRALDYGLEHANKGFTHTLLKEMHNRLLSNDVRGSEKQPGEYKTDVNFTGGTEPLSARFIFASPAHVNDLLDNLFKYANDSSLDTLPPLLKAALLHYQFETIHPFRDGNGRIGRVLIILYLCKEDILSAPLLYLSAYFEKFKQEYKTCLYEVSAKGDVLSWFDFFLQGIIEQADDATTRAKKLEDLRERYSKRTLEKTKSTNAGKLIELLFRSPAITNKQATEFLDTSPSASQYAIDLLIELNILEPVNPDAKRNRVYRSKEILDVLSI